MKTLKITAFRLLIMIGLANLMGCSAKEEPFTTESTDAAASTDAKSEEASEPNPEKKIIKNASVRFQVQNMETSTQRIEQAAKKHQALITNTAQNIAGDEQTTDFEIRVQPQQFLTLLEELQKQSTKLDYRTLSTDDVTLEVVDVAARIKAKKLTEERFISLLKEAKSIEEIMKVEYELQRIREDIERADARLRHMSDQTSYSTIKLSIYQIVPLSFSERVGLGSRFYNAFGTGWQLFISLLVGVCYLWPIVLILIGVWLARRSKLV
ncbi:DUF4349 domain-containing protein [Rufibacter sp. LB8]|uniref:DUF4349 domain-containing protein n=1 Tax=Rufibacter sp. LB8 TaxID=2777781 RepID=UPI00178C539B|nr:DUF4349 domain-containing protein [Rufibacter sp. LB8]